MKMTKKFDKLNETFNVDGEIIPVEAESVSEKIEKYASESNDIKKDYEYARGNLYSLVEKGQEAINGMLELAQESEMPRAYEVLGQLIKTTTETTEKLMALHKIKKDVEEDTPKGPTTVNNALFVGSTTELAKLLKQQSQNQPEQ
jgi:predicted house-cleaning noncanonical NTP pyrophosphatase (MazG superfamily)